MPTCAVLFVDDFRLTNQSSFQALAILSDSIKTTIDNHLFQFYSTQYINGK
jgi:hypothetical protein